MSQACVHCGEDCGKHPIIWDEKPFCCHGCKTVFQILNEKEMTQYYEIGEMPGIRLEEPQVGNTYAFLDLDEIKQKLYEFSDAGLSKVSFFVPGIHCASCIWLLENLGTLHPGVMQSMVNFPKKQLSVTFREEEISLRQLVELLASIHYIPEINLEKTDEKQGSKSRRTLLLKIGITGFVLMNVMMYNLPEYLPGGDLLGSDFQSWFGWLSLMLSIPVVAYSANDYYLSAIKSLRHQIISIDLPIAIGVLTLFLQSAWDIVSGAGIGYLDSLNGLVFFLLVGKWYQGKTYQALSFERNYKSYFPVAVTLIKKGKEEVVPLEKLKAGDRILVRNRELIPADSIIAKGKANIDYSFVTGESIPVIKKESEPVFAGGRQIGPAIELLVSKAVEQSYLTQLWNQEKSDDQIHSRLHELVNKVSQYFTLIILFIAVTAGAYWLVVDKSIAVFVFTSILIVACPCALALTVPFTFGATLRHFGRKGFYLKKTEVIEHLHKVDHIVFDKTGTITQNKAMHIEFVGDDLPDAFIPRIKSLVRHSTHPLSVALFANLQGEAGIGVEGFKEIPGMGITGVIEGKRMNLGSQKFVMGHSINDEEAVLKSRVYLYFQDKVWGYFYMENKYREGLKEVVENLSKSYHLHLLTGDNDAERENLKEIFGFGANLYFNQSPTDKLEYIRQLKAGGYHVLMVGDGLNDAGALNESDVGITIADDIYHFSPACDAILESSEFRNLNRYISFTTRSLLVVKMSFIISFLYNIGGLYFAITGMLTPVVAAVLMPISSITVVAFATFAIAGFARRTLK